MVNTDNALPIGLAFGYAYAGSVAMLTTVLDDVKTVMMAGHIIVALTFLWMQPKVLRSTMGHAEVVERIQQVVEDATVATEPAGRDEEPHPSQKRSIQRMPNPMTLKRTGLLTKHRRER